MGPERGLERGKGELKRMKESVQEYGEQVYLCCVSDTNREAGFPLGKKRKPETLKKAEHRKLLLSIHQSEFLSRLLLN